MAAAVAATPTTSDLLLIGVDIGVVHLALAFARAGPRFQDVAVDRVELINMTCMRHEAVSEAQCTLHHTGMAADRVAHVVQERRQAFDAAHCIVIERQPPGGLRDVEQVLFLMFRAKAVMMAPQTMHAHIGSSQRPYSIRKDLSKLYAQRYVPDLLLRFPDKADDVADAVCLVVTLAHQRAAVAAAEGLRAHAADSCAARGLDLAAFVYTGHRFGAFGAPGALQTVQRKPCSNDADDSHVALS